MCQPPCDHAKNHKYEPMPPHHHPQFWPLHLLPIFQSDCYKTFINNILIPICFFHHLYHKVNVRVPIVKLYIFRILWRPLFFMNKTALSQEETTFCWQDTRYPVKNHRNTHISNLTHTTDTIHIQCSEITYLRSLQISPYKTSSNF